MWVSHNQLQNKCTAEYHSQRGSLNDYQYDILTFIFCLRKTTREGGRMGIVVRLPFLAICMMKSAIYGGRHSALQIKISWYKRNMFMIHDLGLQSKIKCERSAHDSPYVC